MSSPERRRGGDGVTPGHGGAREGRHRAIGAAVLDEPPEGVEGEGMGPAQRVGEPLKQSVGGGGHRPGLAGRVLDAGDPARPVQRESRALAGGCDDRRWRAPAPLDRRDVPGGVGDGGKEAGRIVGEGPEDGACRCVPRAEVAPGGGEDVNLAPVLVGDDDVRRRAVGEGRHDAADGADRSASRGPYPHATEVQMPIRAPGQRRDFGYHAQERVHGWPVAARAASDGGRRGAAAGAAGDGRDGAVGPHQPDPERRELVGWANAIHLDDGELAIG
jgi:hypothetical protein